MARSEPVEHHLVRATVGDTNDIVEMLIRAFIDDPVTCFMFSNEKRRAKALRRFFSIQIKRDFIHTGEVWTTEQKSGAAIWAPPSKPRPGLKDVMRVAPLLRELFPVSHLRVALRALFAVESQRPRTPHWYLATLGTDPDVQGHGVGSTLMNSMLERIDSDGMPAYLECSKERNVSFYARFGFEVSKEMTAVPTAPRIWLMWREARLS